MAKLKILPGGLDIEIYYGATFNPVLTVQDVNDDGTLGAVVDLTGYTASMIVYASADKTTVADTLNTSNGRIVLGGVLGTVTLLTSASAIMAYAFVNGWYDLTLIDAGGLATPYCSGTFDVVKTIEVCEA